MENKTFNYDEVIELMSECLNSIEDHIEVNDCIELYDYCLRIDYDNRVEIEDVHFKCSDLYDEIGIEFRNRLDDLVKYKESSINLKK